MKHIQSAVRRALTDFNMINDGDKIAVGVSGGKDSLTLLTALAEMRRYLPQKYEVIGITLEMGFDNCSTAEIADFCKKLNVEYYTKKTDIAEIIFDIRKEKNPCSLCAKMRRGGVNNFAKELGCNKVALGHHLDDVIETFFLSLFYEGRISCFDPVTYLDRTDITVIRPMLYVEEKDIRGYAKRANLPVMHNPCPADGYTKREDIKQLLKKLESENKNLRERVFHAVKEGILIPTNEKFLKEHINEG